MTDDMTDRAEAPERIWAWNTANCDGDWTIAGGLGVEYVRADIALAMVAEAETAVAVLARAYADALAALEAVKEDARREERERCVNIALGERAGPYVRIPAFHGHDGMSAIDSDEAQVARAIAAAIRADTQEGEG